MDRGNGGVHVTSGNSFCLSCHEMRVHRQELAYSPHAQDAKGNPIAKAEEREEAW